MNGSAQIAPVADDESYPLVRMGAVVSNLSDVELTLDSVDGKRIINIEAVYLCEMDETSLSYVVRIINIPASGKDTTISARPYYVYEKAGKEFVVYDDVVSKAYNDYFALKATFGIDSAGWNCLCDDDAAEGYVCSDIVQDDEDESNYCLCLYTSCPCCEACGVTTAFLMNDKGDCELKFRLKSNMLQPITVTVKSLVETGYLCVKEITSTSEWEEYSILFNSGNMYLGQIIFKSSNPSVEGQEILLDDIFCILR